MNLYRTQIGKTTQILRRALGRVMAHEIIRRSLERKELDSYFWAELQEALQ